MLFQMTKIKGCLIGKRGDPRRIKARHIPISSRHRGRITGRERQWYQTSIIPGAETNRKTLPLSKGNIDTRERFHPLDCNSLLPAEPLSGDIGSNFESRR